MSDTMALSSVYDTPKERILESALRVFAQRGFQGATLREITEQVGLNIAAVNYYYGSKDALIRAVLLRYVQPMVDARMQALDELERSGTSYGIREVVENMVWPLVWFSRDKWGSRSVILLLLQTRAFPGIEFQQIVSELFDPVVNRFVDAFCKLLPGLSREDACWCHTFALGAIVQVLTDADPVARRLERVSDGLCVANDHVIAAQLIDFISAGIVARAHSAPD